MAIETIDEGTAVRNIPAGMIDDASKHVYEAAIRTPLVRLNYDAPAEIYLKLECLQPIGSFKIRGAYNAVRLLLKSCGGKAYGRSAPATPPRESRLPQKGGRPLQSAHHGYGSSSQVECHPPARR